MVVYRVEQPDGSGPYVGKIMSWSDRNHSSFSGHPTVHNDVNVDKLTRWSRDMKKWFCGFIDKEQFNSWFNNLEKINLKYGGYKLVTYEAEDISFGTKQVAFLKGEKISEEELC